MCLDRVYLLLSAILIRLERLNKEERNSFSYIFYVYLCVLFLNFFGGVCVGNSMKNCDMKWCDCRDCDV